MTKTVNQADRRHVDMAAVADWVADTVTLEFGTNSQSLGDGVLKTKAHFEVGVVASR